MEQTEQSLFTALGNRDLAKQVYAALTQHKESLEADPNIDRENPTIATISAANPTVWSHGTLIIVPYLVIIILFCFHLHANAVFYNNIATIMF